MSQRVLVIGTGTIGEPLIGMLAGLSGPLGLDEVIFHKQSPLLEDRSKVTHLLKRGAKLAVNGKAAEDFEALDMPPAYEKVEAIDRADVVIDCTPKGYGNINKRDHYQHFEHNTHGFIAQGSEFGFGKMFAHGVNDDALVRGQDRYIQVVSCNTHNLAALVDTIALSAERDNLRSGRFVCVRRANDLSQSGSFVPAPSVSDHDETIFGTHHARDAYHLFRTLGLELDLFSSAMKINTQYMHTVHFDLGLRIPTTRGEVEDCLHAHPHIALTHKREQNLIFSFGRDYGHYGRILDNTVVVLPSLHVDENGRRVTGFCFTPQDGNSLLSSLAATLWFLDPDRYRDGLQAVTPYMFDEV
ncbi:MAG: hypothetical protein ABEL51_14030 [Salinibacter sp.]